jgi:hypothetical protein
MKCRFARNGYTDPECRGERRGGLCFEHRRNRFRLILEPESGDPLRLLVDRHRLRWNGEKWIEVEDEATWTDREALVLGTVRIVAEDGSEVEP